MIIILMLTYMQFTGKFSLQSPKEHSSYPYFGNTRGLLLNKPLLNRLTNCLENKKTTVKVWGSVFCDGNTTGGRRSYRGLKWQDGEAPLAGCASPFGPAPTGKS